MGFSTSEEKMVAVPRNSFFSFTFGNNNICFHIKFGAGSLSSFLECLAHCIFFAQKTGGVNIHSILLSRE